MVHINPHSIDSKDSIYIIKKGLVRNIDKSRPFFILILLLHFYLLYIFFLHLNFSIFFYIFILFIFFFNDFGL